MAALEELRDIKQDYNGKTALRGVSLDVRENEILAIIGPNGAGKTTLLRIMALLDEPASGEVLYRGKRVDKSNSTELRKNCTMVFQQAVLFDTTVFKNVAYGLKLRGYSGKEVEKRVGRALEFVGMKSFSERRAKALSGGEQQRVVIARALALEPELLLLDEPTANLDPINTAMVEKIIKEIEQETSVVVATNNLLQARRLPDRVACILNGALIDIGKAERIFRHPKERTRDFIRGKFF